jgi:hypothetical protein
MDLLRLSFVKNHPADNDQQTNQEHKNRNPVNPVHVAYPGAGWLIRISFPEVKIFCKFL